MLPQDTFIIFRSVFQSTSPADAVPDSCGCLPQYTFIMLAGKAVPKQCVDYLSGKVKTRRSIGVRMPADPICQVPTRHRMHSMCFSCWTLLHVTRSSDTDARSTGHRK